MIFSLIVIILIGVIAFFHYTQGFFSSAISALLAIISAALAISYQEPIVNNFLGGKFADQINCMTTIVLFAVIYCILRFIFDAAVPGNVRLPVLMDKIGAGVMGLIAGAVAAGVFAFAAQMLPFGPNIGGYGRFPTSDDRQVQIAGLTQQSQDMDIHDELKSDTFNPDEQRKMILPADDWVVNFVSYLSEPGSALAGDRPISAIHPDWINELFADRLGVEPGGKRVAINAGKTKQVQVTGLYDPPSLPEIGGESPDIRHDQPSGTVKSSTAQLLLVVRTEISKDATDDDNFFRFSMADCHLVTPNGKIYYGIGTVEGGSTLLASRLDDFLFIDMSRSANGADIAFLVNPSDVLAPTKTGQPAHIAEGVFLQVKRLGYVDLAGKELIADIPPDENKTLLRKQPVIDKIHPKEEAVTAPLDYQDIQTSDKLFTQINVGTPDADVKDQQLNSGTVSLKDHKFSKLDINATDTIQRMKQGGYPIDELYASEGKTIIQISCRPNGDNAWQWAGDITQYQLEDKDGHKYPPSGAIAKLKEAAGQDKLAATYDAANPPSSLSQQDGRPTDVYLIYQVPAGTQAKQWDYQGKLVHSIQ